MSAEDQYKLAHKTAKAVVCAIVIFLLLLARYYDTVFLDATAVVIWFFGVNPIGYVLETLLQFKHRHEKL